MKKNVIQQLNVNGANIETIEYASISFKFMSPSFDKEGIKTYTPTLVNGLSER